MSGCTELSILAGSCNFSQKILIDITHDILVVHIHGINSVNNFCQNFSCRNQEHSVLHVTAEGGIFSISTYGLNKREYIGLNVGKHFFRFKVMKNVPPQILIVCFYTRVFAYNTNTVFKQFVF